VALDVAAVTIEGEWYRHIPHRGKLSYRPSQPVDGRWQHGDVAEALYFADTEETVWAEWYRALDEFGLPPQAWLPRNLWKFIIEAEVADLRDEDRLARVGLGTPPPTRASWPAFQELGDQLHREGWHGLVAPSSANPGGQVLCLYRETEKIPGVKAVPPPKVFRNPPPRPRGATVWPPGHTG
jgi:RES domain-containing protein